MDFLTDNNIFPNDLFNIIINLIKYDFEDSLFLGKKFYNIPPLPNAKAKKSCYVSFKKIRCINKRFYDATYDYFCQTHYFDIEKVDKRSAICQKIQRLSNVSYLPPNIAQYFSAVKCIRCAKDGCGYEWCKSWNQKDRVKGKPIVPVKIPQIERLENVDAINIIEILPSLKQIHFSDNFEKYRIHSIYHEKCMQIVQVENVKSPDILKYFKNAHTVYFHDDFNESLYGLPESVKIIKTGVKYNKPLQKYLPNDIFERLETIYYGNPQPYIFHPKTDISWILSNESMSWPFYDQSHQFMFNFYNDDNLDERFCHLETHLQAFGVNNSADLYKMIRDKFKCFIDYEAKGYIKDHLTGGYILPLDDKK